VNLWWESGTFAIPTEYLLKGLILRGQPCADNHQDEGSNKKHAWNLTENQQGENDTYEGRYGIVGAGACGTEDSLGIDIKEYAESVSHESKQENHWYCPRVKDTLATD